MQISLDTTVIQSYSPGEIKINGQLFTHNLIISPTELIDPWRCESIENITADDLKIILPLNPEVVLLGTGSRLQFPDPKFLSIFLEQKIGIEVMDTGAACRTFNVLISEGRNAVAALLIK